MPDRIIDLTFPIHEGMTTFPVYWHPFVEITQLGRLHFEKRETRKVVLGTHTGTHCDAPRHFIPGGATIDKVPLETLVGPAFVVDFSDAAERQEMTPDDLAKRIGDRRPERVILRYDWSDRFEEDNYYDDHAFLSEAACQWLIDRGVKLVAMDTPMPDNPKNGKGCAKDSPCHKIILGNGAILVEYLTNLRALSREEVELIVLPMKIRDGDGSPVRAIAIERDA